MQLAVWATADSISRVCVCVCVCVLCAAGGGITHGSHRYRVLTSPETLQVSKCFAQLPLLGNQESPQSHRTACSTGLTALSQHKALWTLTLSDRHLLVLKTKKTLETFFLLCQGVFSVHSHTGWGMIT